MATGPWPVALDPLTWQPCKLARCIEAPCERQASTLLVTTSTRTRRTRAFSAYLSHLLDPAEVDPTWTRRAVDSPASGDMVGQHDPTVFTVALGVSDTVLIRYQGDGVDHLTMPREQHR